MTMLPVPVAKLDIASDSDSEDRGFESRRARFITRICVRVHTGNAGAGLTAPAFYM